MISIFKYFFWFLLCWEEDCFVKRKHLSQLLQLFSIFFSWLFYSRIDLTSQFLNVKIFGIFCKHFTISFHVSDLLLSKRTCWDWRGCSRSYWRRLSSWSSSDFLRSKTCGESAWLCTWEFLFDSVFSQLPVLELR